MPAADPEHGIHPDTMTARICDLPPPVCIQPAVRFVSLNRLFCQIVGRHFNTVSHVCGALPHFPSHETFVSPQHVLLSSTYLECVKCVCGALTAEHPPGRCAAGQWTDGAHHARNVRHRPESNLDSDIRRGNRRVGREEGRSGGGGGGGCDAEVCAGGVGGDGGVG